MTKHGHSKSRKDKSNRYQQKSQADGHTSVDHMNTLPNQQPPNLHEDTAPDERNPPTPSEFIAAVYNWLLHYWDAPRDKAKWTDVASIIINVVVAGAALYSVWIFQGQLKEAREATTEMRRSTEIQERPWLSVEAKPVSGVIFVNGKQAALALKFSVKNVGHSIAKDIHIDAKMFPTDGTFPIPPFVAKQHQKELCDSPKNNPIEQFDLFAVEQPAERGVSMSTVPSAEQVISVNVDGNTRQFMGLYVVGCLTYHSSFGNDMRQTFFAYDVIRHIGFENGKPLITTTGMPLTNGFEIGINAPNDEVSLTQERIARNDAY